MVTVRLIFTPPDDAPIRLDAESTTGPESHGTFVPPSSPRPVPVHRPGTTNGLGT